MYWFRRRKIYSDLSVSKRMREHGIRVALGAQPVQLVRATLGKPLLLLLSWIGHRISSGPVDHRYTCAPGLLRHPARSSGTRGSADHMTLLGVLATWIPARRALRIDPVRLLRE
jgi:hypothetical protein